MRIIAHRGARFEEPENTRRAIKRAFECHADAVEIDVRVSKDHHLVVIHDDTLERTTNGSGKVCEQTLDQLRRLDAGKGEQIPMLSEVLLLLKELGLELVIELKEEGIEERVVRAIKEAGMEHKVIISSFFHHSLLIIKEHAPELKTGIILASLPLFPVQLAIDVHADSIFQKYPRLNRAYVADATSKGIELYPWTINTREDFEKVRELGVSGVVTDNPCLFKYR
ncbi:MAG: glycerophosphodiester phosphodiesterase [Methanophagales archaeon ANME-1-THS]|nr:MAG: glycerophosphodiester phosphodiesterase [Methanophagales archaeon ANME-1-THS]